MKAGKFRELSAEELALRIRETKGEVASMRMKKRSGVPVENYGSVREKRRDVARMLTIQTERENQ